MHEQQLLSGEFLAAARDELRLCQRRIRHCVDQLSEAQLWWRAGESFNSVANLLLHLSGNLGERIIGLAGGEPYARDRPQEFAARGGLSKAEVIGQFDATIARADAALAALPEDRLAETRRFQMLQGEVERAVLKIIVQTLVHLGGHTQEIVALTRLQLREAYRFMA